VSISAEGVQACSLEFKGVYRTRQASVYNYNKRHMEVHVRVTLNNQTRFIPSGSAQHGAVSLHLLYTANSFELVL